jgi:DNA-directed RNA polymerase subunit RPC12/RpoP
MRRLKARKWCFDTQTIKVIKRDWTYATVRYIWDNSPDAVSDEKIEELYVKLKVLTNVDAAVKAAHIDNIEKRYKNAVDRTNGEVQIEEQINDAQTENSDYLVCPRCGSKLVLRIAKKVKMQVIVFMVAAPFQSVDT